MPGEGMFTWRSRAFALFLGLATAVAAIEIYLRCCLPQPLGLSYRAPSGLTLNIPGASVRYRRTEFDHIVRINSLGLRDDEIAIGKSPDVFRILVLGDSFAEGKQVALAETFPKQLQRLLSQRFPTRHWQVINGGISGYGTADEIKFFETLGRTFTPDLVILAFCVGNDVQNNASSAYFQFVDSRLVELPLEPPSRGGLAVARIAEFLASHVHLYQFLRDRYHRSFSAHPEPLEEMPAGTPTQALLPAAEEDWRLTEALLDRLLELVRAEHAAMLLVAIPQRLQVFDDEWVASTGLDPGARARVEPQIRLTAYARRQLLPFLDPLADLHDANLALGRTHFRVDGHFTALGHRVTAETIVQSLVNFHLLGDTR